MHNTFIENHIQIDDIKLWTRVEGAGIPVLLCNGGPGDGDYLQPITDMMCDIAQSIRFEQRGCGRSEINQLYGMDTCINDLEEIRRFYKIDKWIIGGHSWGADLALAYSLNYPEHTYGLIHISGTGIQNDRDWKEAYNQGRAEHIENEPIDIPFNKEVNTTVIHSWRKFIKEPDLLKRLAHLSCPTLFIYGSEDIRPSWPVEQLAHLIPHAALNIIRGADHYIWHTHALEMKQVIREFISSVKRSNLK